MTVGSSSTVFTTLSRAADVGGVPPGFEIVFSVRGDTTPFNGEFFVLRDFSEFRRHYDGSKPSGSGKPAV